MAQEQIQQQDMSPALKAELMSAIREGEVPTVKKIVAVWKGVNLDFQHFPHKGNTPLIGACLMLNLEICKILLDNGANPNMHKATTDEYPLSILCAIDDPNTIPIADLLAAHGATMDLEMRTRPYTTALNKACFNGVVPMVEWLIKHGASTRDPFKSGWNALEISATAASNVLATAHGIEKLLKYETSHLGHSGVEAFNLSTTTINRSIDRGKSEVAELLNIIKILIAHDPNIKVDALRIDTKAKEIVRKEIKEYNISRAGLNTTPALGKPKNPDNDDETTDVDPGLAASAPSETVKETIMVQEQIQHRPKKTYTELKGLLILHIKEENLAGVRKTLTELKGMDLDFQYDGHTPLIDACVKRNFAICEILLAHGVNPDITCRGIINNNRVEITPLHSICYSNNPNNAAIAELLISRGATVDDNRLYDTALDLACINGVVPMVNLLLNHGASITHTCEETRKNTFEKAAMTFSWHTYKKIIHLLIAKNWNIEIEVDALRIDTESKEVIQQAIEASRPPPGRLTKVALREAKPLDPDDDATTDVDPESVASAPSETVALANTLEAMVMDMDAPRVVEAMLFPAAAEIEQPAAAPASNAPPLMDLALDFANLLGHD